MSKTMTVNEMLAGSLVAMSDEELLGVYGGSGGMSYGECLGLAGVTVGFAQNVAPINPIGGLIVGAFGAGVAIGCTISYLGGGFY